MPRSPLTITLETTGESKTLQMLAGSKIPGAKNIARRRFVRFAAAVRNDMRAGAPVREGVLRKNVKSASTRSGGAKVFVDKGKAPHWYVSGEGGTKQRRTKRGANRGAVKQKQWIEPVRARARANFHAEVVVPTIQEIKDLIVRGK